MSKFKIIDDFIGGQIDARRFHATHRDFQEVGATGVVYPGIARLPIIPMVDHSLLERKVSRFQHGESFFRLTMPSQPPPTYIHNDLALADITAILYLNRMGKGGTALWKHRESGLTSAPTSADLQRLGLDYMRKLIEDGTDESKWELDELCDMKYGRLVAFDSGLWHSCYPRGGWGTDAEDGRLIQVYFLKGLTL